MEAPPHFPHKAAGSRPSHLAKCLMLAETYSERLRHQGAGESMLKSHPAQQLLRKSRIGGRGAQQSTTASG